MTIMTVIVLGDATGGGIEADVEGCSFIKQNKAGQERKGQKSPSGLITAFPSAFPRLLENFRTRSCHHEIQNSPPLIQQTPYLDLLSVSVFGITQDSRQILCGYFVVCTCTGITYCWDNNMYSVYGYVLWHCTPPPISVHIGVSIAVRRQGR